MDEKKLRAFDEFWAAYPRRQARRDAERTWAKIPNMDEALLGVILDAIHDQKKSKQWFDGFIPLPATWLRGERWNDELDPRRDIRRAKL